MEIGLTVTADGGLAFEDGADRGRVIVSGSDTGGRYALMEWTVAPGCSAALSFGVHRHGALEETFYVRSGQLEFLLGEVVSTLGPGDFVRVPPGVRHGYANVSDKPVELLVGFHPGGFEALFLKYRTDRVGPPAGPGFMEEAGRDHATTFEAD